MAKSLNDIKIGGMSHTHSNREYGFSFIELIIVIGIILVVSTVAIISLRSLVTQTDLSGNARSIVSTLNLAKSKTVSSEGASQWGAHFEADRFALFKGTAYNSADSNTKIYTLPSTLEISSIALNGGGANVLFTRITGQTTNYGSVAIREKDNITNSRTITIENSGQSNITTLEQPPSGTRTTDSRHIHFTYNSNTQNASTMTLTFPDFPTDNISIAFQDFLTAPKDSFDWEQTVTVNNISRIIKIHTHLLNSGQTDFSIHREKENNTEAIQLALDGQNLVNYTAAGQESQGSSAWVTAPARQ